MAQAGDPQKVQIRSVWLRTLHICTVYFFLIYMQSLALLTLLLPRKPDVRKVGGVDDGCVPDSIDGVLSDTLVEASEGRVALLGGQAEAKAHCKPDGTCPA